MTRKVSTMRALLMSALSLLLCVSMLIGTTYAWFTDSVTSGSNVITSGNLDIDVQYTLGEKDAAGELIWANLEGATDLFKKGLWEPGHTEVVALKIENKGSLALKYNANMNIFKENVGKTKEGDSIVLSDILTVSTLPMDGGPIGGALASTIFTSDDAAIWQSSEVKTSSFKAGNVLANNNIVLAGEDAYVLIKVDMAETVGNEANHNGVDIPSIEFGVNVFATQYTYEADSFNDQYDAEASLDFAPVSNENELRAALNNKEENILLTKNIPVSSDYTVDYNANINGAGYTLYRTGGVATMALAAESTPPVYTGVVFNVKAGQTLTLENIVVDGGAVWTGAINPVLERGTVNAGVTATGALVNVAGNGVIILNEGAVLQNNDGANAVFLETRKGGSLILNGGEIINNSSAAGAVWGGGNVIINSGKINNNYGNLGGAIRTCYSACNVTMNGGEMNHNYSTGVGGAIYASSSPSSNVYTLNGGEMAYNYSESTGGAIYAGYKESVKIGGDFKMHHNDCAANIGAAIRFHTSATFTMTGGEIYDNGNNTDSLYLNNNSASITGGRIKDNFGYSGGVGLTWGEAVLDGVIAYNLSTNHNTAYLAKEFGTLRFTVNENDPDFANFNFKPATDYVYTEGDEAMLICMNDGYETYWNAESGTFRLQAK